MKRLMLVLGVMMSLGLAAVATAGDYHNGAALICSDCHIAHGSQAHGYTSGGAVLSIGSAAPYDYLLRNEPNETCLNCHNNSNSGPDVLGANNGMFQGIVREAGALNIASGHGITNDVGYDDIDGHTLYSVDAAPGGTFTNPDGLECINCHAQHGQTVTQYRNLTTSPGGVAGGTLTYAVGVNNLTKDVYEISAAGYDVSNVWFNEPDQTKSAMGNWCKGCHTDFHGQGGDAWMGGRSGGNTGTAPPNVPWKRHPTADVNIGHAGSPTFISSLAQYAGHTNKVKVMDNQGIWDGSDPTVTPSCMSCHKAHGNQNGFGLIFMKGTGTVTEEGDGGVYKDMCRQCHVQGG